jgi:hypothetical protein
MSTASENSIQLPPTEAPGSYRRPYAPRHHRNMGLHTDGTAKPYGKRLLEIPEEHRICSLIGFLIGANGGRCTLVQLWACLYAA